MQEIAQEFNFASRRSPVLARRGIVAATQPLAAQAGLGVLQAGGNAADAAVATAAALAVVEPMSTGIGGDCFAPFYDAAGGTVEALNASGRAPAGLTLDVVRAAGETGRAIGPGSPHAITVPGAAAGWADAVARWGRRDLASALAPAIALAEEGFPVTPVIAWQWADGAEQLEGEGGGLLPGGAPPRAGSVFRNPDFAAVLREVAADGPAAFYEGRVGSAIAAAVAARGGLLSMADLAAHHSTFEPPISTMYRGLRVHEPGPNGQGLVALLALNILGGFDPEAVSGGSASALHLQIEALRLAFADGRRFIADPDTAGGVPVAELLSEEYAAARRALIDPARRIEVAPGEPLPASDTVYLSAVDGNGNACSFINSTYGAFGTGIVPAGCGFALQNRGAGFTLEAGHPNVVAPGKRPYHTIIPALSTHADGPLHACFGVMGGWNQPQGQLQVLSHLTDGGLDPQAALDAPRFSIFEDPPDGPVLAEPSLGEATLSGLEARGHPVERLTATRRLSALGRGQVIVRGEDGVLWGGSDPRADGCAVGW
jgi:gamma-glutamyltranspeptidase/glutathione hydrolase